MPELRWNPLLATWTMVAGNRQQRPNLPKNNCPFCPGSGKVPDHYDVLVYENDFPTLTLNPDAPDISGDEFYRTMENYGKCEVILYSPEHATTLPQLSSEHITKLIRVWTERFKALAENEKIKCIFIFENRGEEVGVTMPHPHGQLYGYPFVPLKIKVELDNCKHYFHSTGNCMLCKMNEEEINFKKRVVMENESFIAYLPFFTDYPYGVFIVSKSHHKDMSTFSNAQQQHLAEILKNVTGTFDTLFNKLFPYMMVLHQSPVNAEEYKDSGDYYHFHIEFYPPLRSPDKIKYYASSEIGAWAAANTRAVEETAEELRNAFIQFQKK